MGFLLKSAVACGVVLALAAGVLGLLAVEVRPLVVSTPQAAANFDRIERILRDHDPRDMQAGTVRTLTLTESELTLVANQLLNYYGPGAAAIRLDRGSLDLEASLRVRGLGEDRFLNLRVAAASEGGRPRVEAVWFGRLRVPGWLAEPMLRVALGFVGGKGTAHLIQSVGISPENLRITYRWEPELLETLRRRLVVDADPERLELFHERLVELVAVQGNRQRVAMKSLLAGLFGLAAERASDSPVADNRAILMVLGTYVNHRSLEPLVPSARDWTTARRLTMTLDGRKDLARHFLTSAALAVTGGGFLSDTMGVYKEIVDAKEGSGFSFTDLAANRAGTRFAELATKSPEAARNLWQLFTGPVQERDFMPRIEGLPEFMSESAFQTRFGEVGSPAYNRFAREIEQRISSLSLYRQS